MHDLLIEGGQVIDPETGHDACADVAITGNRITAVGRVSGQAAQTIDARGLVVAPGFVDLHAHGQSLPADRMQSFDGVTTALELELGVLPVAPWYAEQARLGRMLNYGASTGWAFARVAALTGQSPASSVEGLGQAMREGRWMQAVASSRELSSIVAQVRTGLAEGGIGIGLPHAYAPGAGAKEMSALCSLAADFGTPTFTHVAYMSDIDPQSSIEAYTLLLGHAAATGAHMHICHFNSTSLHDVDQAALLVRTAQAQGLKITVEAYPYGTGSTLVGAAFFTDPLFPERTGGGYDAIEMVASGQRIVDREALLAAQAEDPGTPVLFHFLDVASDVRHRDLLDTSVLFPGGAIASDAGPWFVDGATYEGDAWPLPEGAVSHPRSAGTFTRFLRQWVRERGLMPLIEGLDKCSLTPSRILEPALPAMRRKGRLQPGCDADIVVFEWAALSDQAEFRAMNRPATGMRHVLVGGTPVIADGQLVLDARPGRPVRREVVAPAG